MYKEICDLITRDDDKIADILARQSYKNEDNPHVGYSQAISDGGARGKEHLIRNIFYDDRPVTCYCISYPVADIFLAVNPYIRYIKSIRNL